MKWDVDKGHEASDPLLEVKRAKKMIESTEAKPARAEVSLSAEEDGVGGGDLNFKRQTKRRVKDYRYTTTYNVGKTKSPYVLTRNSVVMMVEEELGVEIVVRGSYKPEELNGDTDDSDALVYEVGAATPEELQEAMFRLPSIVKSMPMFPWLPSSASGRYVRRGNMRYYSYRVPVDLSLAESRMDEIRKEVESIASRMSVEVIVRGRFSGHVEPCLGEESNEPTYIHIVAKTKGEIREARRACREAIGKYAKT